MDFTALMVIQYIDQSYFDSYKDPLKDILVQEYNFELPVNKTNISYKELNNKDKLYLGLTDIINQIYEIFYFHFLPYWSMYYCYYTYNNGGPQNG